MFERHFATLLSYGGLRAQAAFLLAVLLCGGVASAAAQAGGVPPSVSTIRTTARLVLVDVVVRDHGRHPVHNLSASDFTVTENGAPQNIRSFEEHVDSQRTKTELARMPPGDFTNYSPVEADSSLNVILLDALNTPLTDQVYARQQAIDYLKKAQPGARIAIFGLTQRLLLLQGFTQNNTLLLAALQKKATSQTSPLLDSNESSTAVNSDTIGYSESLGVEASNAQQFASYNNSFQTQLRVRYTLDAMNLLGRYLATLSGRKNLIWFSGAFPINILPDENAGRGGNPFAGIVGMEDEFRDTTDLLSRARVAVYPVDARGLVGFANIAGSGPMMDRKSQQAQFANAVDSHTSMNRMADQTGGKPFYNTNSLSEALASAVEDGSTYYTIGYTPSDAAEDGRYRKIGVKTSREGLNLQYRRGYYAADAQHPAAEPRPGTQSPPAADPALRLALTHGAPDISDLIFRVAVAPTSAAVHEESRIHGLRDATYRGPFRTFQVHFALDAAGMGFTRTQDGHYQPKVRFVVFVYDRDGRLAQGIAEEPSSALTGAAVRTILQRGLQYPMEVEVPDRGEYFLRIGVEDELKRHVGSLELPIDSVRTLPPVAPLAARAGTAVHDSLPAVEP